MRDLSRCWNAFMEGVEAFFSGIGFAVVMFLPLIVLRLVGIGLSPWATVAVFAVWQGLLLIARFCGHRRSELRRCSEVRRLHHMYEGGEVKDNAPRNLSI